MESMISFESGELVRWYENYSDMITKDSGIGLILKKQTYKLGNCNTSYTNYRVYRNKHHDVMTFDINELIKIRQEK